MFDNDLFDDVVDIKAILGNQFFEDVHDRVIPRSVRPLAGGGERRGLLQPAETGGVSGVVNAEHAGALGHHVGGLEGSQRLHLPLRLHLIRGRRH